MSVLSTSRETLPLMRSSGGGVIVNISAADGLEPTLMFPVSGSMRVAVSALTKLLARRFGPERIRVNSVLPWVVLDPDSDWESSEIPLSRAATYETGCRRGLLPLQQRRIVSHRRKPPGRRRVVEGTVRNPAHPGMSLAIAAGSGARASPLPCPAWFA